MLDSSAFILLKNTLSDSRNLQLCRFEALTKDTDLSPIDLQIRTKFQTSKELYAGLYQRITALPAGVILALKDRFLLRTILFRTAYDELYSIGPFRHLPYTEEDYITLQRKNGLTLSQLEMLKLLLGPVPCNILRSEPVSVAKNILQQGYGIENPQVQVLSLDTYDAPIPHAVPVEDLNLRAKRVEHIYDMEGKLLNAIREGDESRAMDCGRFFISSNIGQQKGSKDVSYLQSHRSLIYASNTLFRKTAQDTGIHPVFLDEISRRFAQQLSLSATHEQLDAVYLEMIHDYCQMCREQSTKGRSPRIQAIMHYVQFNYSDDLSPEVVAEAIHFSPSYLSRRFKEEVGISFMSYVTQYRIHKAQELLIKPNLTVREVANYVGIPDWNYFTKLFKKETGQTPSNYRSSLNFRSEK